MAPDLIAGKEYYLISALVDNLQTMTKLSLDAHGNAQCEVSTRNNGSIVRSLCATGTFKRSFKGTIVATFTTKHCEAPDGGTSGGAEEENQELPFRLEMEFDVKEGESTIKPDLMLTRVVNHEHGVDMDQFGHDGCSKNSAAVHTEQRQRRGA